MEPIIVLKSTIEYLEHWLINYPNNKLLYSQQEMINNISDNIQNEERLVHDMLHEPPFISNNLPHELLSLNSHLNIITRWLTMHPLKKFQPITSSQQKEIDAKIEAGTLTKNQKFNYDIRIVKSRLICLLEHLQNRGVLTKEEEEKTIEEEDAKRTAIKAIMESGHNIPNIPKEAIFWAVKLYDALKKKIEITDEYETLLKNYETNIRPAYPYPPGHPLCPSGTEIFIADMDVEVKKQIIKRLELNAEIKDFNQFAKKYGLKRFSPL